MGVRSYALARITTTISIAVLLPPVNAADAKADKKRSEGALQRGNKAEAAGKPDDAIAAYTEAIQADRSNAAALRARGRAYFTAGERLKSLADLEEAIKLQPGDPLSYAERAEYYRRSEHPLEALRDYDAAREAARQQKLLRYQQMVAS